MTTTQLPSGRPFYLLGAGFSRAVHRAMPLLPDLRSAVITILNLDSLDLEPFGTDLEAWMSFLSSPQPWLTDQDNLRNQALFGDASLAVSEAIKNAEANAIGDSIPTWLIRLANQWCDEQASIASFNYDLLAERALTDTRRLGTVSDIYGMSLERREPASSGISFGTSAPASAVPVMYKLHGSVNWMYGGVGAHPRARVTLIDSRAIWRSVPREQDESWKFDRSRYLFDDLVPLIIPPTGTKSAYLGNAAVRAQWQRAANDLRQCGVLNIIGYSFPPSDTTVRQFLSHSLKDSLAHIRVIDPNSAVARTVAELAPRCVVETFADLESFIDATCGDTVTWQLTSTATGYAPLVRVNGIEEGVPKIAGSDVIPDDEFPAVAADLDARVRSRWPSMPGIVVTGGPLGNPEEIRRGWVTSQAAPPSHASPRV